MAANTAIKKGRFELVDIRRAWDFIKPDIERLKFEHQLDWRVEDVYAHCLFGKAVLWGCADGFVIVRPQHNQFSLEIELFVWICISKHDDGLSEYHPDICAIAKDVHATSIIFESPRPGFLKLARQKHWPTMTSYRLAVA